MRHKLSIFIADDHPIVRKGLREIIEEEPGLAVIAEAGDGETSLALIEEFRPDIVILDLNMPKLDGFSVAEELHKRKLAGNIIFLTVHSDIAVVQKAMDLGNGYILKESALVEIVSGIRSVADGKPYVSPSLAFALLSWR
jgi:DNA-binding NarL/FixJ family response regulator